MQISSYLLFVIIEVELIYNIVSGVYHSDLVTYIWSISQAVSFILTIPDVFSTVGTIPTVPAGERNAGRRTLLCRWSFWGPNVM